MTPDLWKLREWLTISEAAQYLSSAMKQEVSESDILRLGLDAQLKLSVSLPTGTKGWYHPEGVDVTRRPTSVTLIDGVWDLAMEGAGKQQIEHEYHFRASLPFISVNGIAGAWVERGGVRRQLVPMTGSTGMWSHSPSALSDGSVLGVRVSRLDEFAAQMTPVTSRSPLEDATWRDRWRQQDAWTVREFAQLCCGLNPDGVDNFPNGNMGQYNEARDAIHRAIRVKVLSTLDDLAWPATGPEQMYDATPAFKPSEVASWAAKRYPSTFPYSAGAWDDKTSADVIDDKPLGEKERGTLLKIIAGLAKAADVDISKPSKAAQSIEALIQDVGATVSARAIENHLNRIPDLLERRGKSPS